MKRLFSILLVFCMIFSMMPVSAFAAETEETGELHTGHVHSEEEEGGEFAEAGTFDELESAIANGGRIKLVNNISSDSLVVNCDVVLDLNGHDLNLAFFEITAGGTLTVNYTDERILLGGNTVWVYEGSFAY